MIGDIGAPMEVTENLNMKSDNKTQKKASLNIKEFAKIYLLVFNSKSAGRNSVSYLDTVLYPTNEPVS